MARVSGDVVWVKIVNLGSFRNGEGARIRKLNLWRMSLPRDATKACMRVAQVAYDNDGTMARQITRLQ